MTKFLSPKSFELSDIRAVEERSCITPRKRREGYPDHFAVGEASMLSDNGGQGR